MRLSQALSTVIFPATVMFSGAAGMAGVTPLGTYNGAGAGTATAVLTSLGGGMESDAISKNFQSVGPISITFPVVPTDGFTDTAIVTETITNSTGVTWTGYDVTLSNSLVTFSSTTSNSNFATVNRQPRTIDYSNGTVAPGGVLNVAFNLSIPDNTSESNYQFTLTQTPVPEPASFGLLATSVAAGFLVRRRV